MEQDIVDMLPTYCAKAAKALFDGVCTTSEPTPMKLTGDLSVPAICYENESGETVIKSGLYIPEGTKLLDTMLWVQIWKFCRERGHAGGKLPDGCLMQSITPLQVSSFFETEKGVDWVTEMSDMKDAPFQFLVETMGADIGVVAVRKAAERMATATIFDVINGDVHSWALLQKTNHDNIPLAVPQLLEGIIPAYCAIAKAHFDRWGTWSTALLDELNLKTA